MDRIRVGRNVAVAEVPGPCIGRPPGEVGEPDRQGHHTRGRRGREVCDERRTEHRPEDDGIGLAITVAGVVRGQTRAQRRGDEGVHKPRCIQGGVLAHEQGCDAGHMRGRRTRAIEGVRETARPRHLHPVGRRKVGLSPLLGRRVDDGHRPLRGVLPECVLEIDRTDRDHAGIGRVTEDRV